MRLNINASIQPISFDTLPAVAHQQSSGENPDSPAGVDDNFYVRQRIA